VNNSLLLDPIGVFHTTPLEKYELPRQPENEGTIGCIQLEGGKNFEQALEGLEHFERIWIVFGFHKAKGWSPKVLPTRSKEKVGVFASRSPHRPTPIGMSCVRLVAIQKRRVVIAGADLIDQTPIFDIKPYIPYCDSFPHCKAGWVDEIAQNEHRLQWSRLALRQREYLCTEQVVFKEDAFQSLRFFSGPNHYNRIRFLQENKYVLAYKTWRFLFSLDSEDKKILILEIFSGYSLKELSEGFISEKHLHIRYLETFQYSILHGREYARLC
jgi:tRNA (adenine37-N6)-methyltransferase